MKRTAILIVITMFIFTSCQDSSKGIKDAETEQTPEVFQEHTVLENVSSYSKRGKYQSLIDRLYNELIEKDEELKKIEKEFKLLTQNNSNTEINDFLSNNEKYYDELKPLFTTQDSIINMKSQVLLIQDSILREKMKIEVNKSEKKYKNKINNLKNLLESIRNKTIEMIDYRTALKISLTLNSIEKYQDKFNQDTTSIKDLINRHDDISNAMKTKISDILTKSK